MLRNGLLAALLSALATTTALAHHPFMDEFDSNMPVTITGTVTKMEWRNPHVYAFVDAKDPQGKMTSWKIEMGSPSALMKEGWTQTSVTTGDLVTIKAWRARNNPALANAESFMLASGSKLTAASSLPTDADRLAEHRAADQAVGTSGQAQPEQRELPSTAGSSALYGLLGALSLAGAYGLRFFRN